MNCMICKSGHTQQGTTTVTLERDEKTLVFKGVLAQIFQNCVDDETTKQLLAIEGGVQVEIRDFTPPRSIHTAASWS